MRQNSMLHAPLRLLVAILVLLPLGAYIHAVGAVPRLPTLTVSDLAVSEGTGGGNAASVATVAVTLSEPSEETVTLSYATEDATALAPQDYAARSGTLSIAAGQTTATFTVPIVGDALDEADETFVVQLSNPDGATLADEQAAITITDDDASPDLSLSDLTVDEGDTGQANAVFTATLSTLSGRPVTVAYTTADGSAHAPDDYTAAVGPTAGSVTIPAGQTTATFAVPVAGDTLNESDEAFTVTLSDPVGATLDDGEATCHITDDDPLPSLSIEDVTLAEGNTGESDAVFTVTLSAPSGRVVTVNAATSDGSAVAGADYTATTGIVTFPPGTTTQTVQVPVQGDTLYEASEQFALSLSGATNATLPAAVSNAAATITNDDAAPVLAISNPTVTEGDTPRAEGAQDVTLTVTLSQVSAQNVTVDYATQDGTAHHPGDYATRTGTLSIPAGQLSTTLAVPVYGDALDEDAETFTVQLSNPVGATLGGMGEDRGTVTITDDDEAPSLSVADVALTEGDAGSVDALFPVTLSALSGRAVTVAYATSDGSAHAPGDYASTTGTVTIPAGQITAEVAVPILGDELDEADTSFTLTLSSPTAATITDGEATGTIVDDDAPPALSIGDVTVVEGNGGAADPTQAHFSVTLSAPSAQVVTVQAATAATMGPGAAAEGDDYTATTQALTFAAGETSKTFSVPVVGDDSDEVTETFLVQLSGAVNATLDTTGGASSATGTITDDDETSAPAAPTGISASPGEGQVTLAWNGGPDADAYVVKRSLTAGGPYVPVHRVEGSPFVDGNLDNGTPYYYVVAAVAVNAEGADITSADSEEASATPSATAAAGFVDALIRNEGDQEFLGENTHNDSGLNQTKEQQVPPGGTALYRVQVRNTGGSNARIRLRGDGDSAGWTVLCKDAEGNDITEAVVSTTGWETPILSTNPSQGSAYEVSIEVAADTVATSSQSVLVRAASSLAPAHGDAVKAITSVANLPEPTPTTAPEETPTPALTPTPSTPTPTSTPSAPTGTSGPANDNFENAQTLAGDSGNLTASSVQATGEANEPAHAYFGGEASIWYRWTPSFTGRVLFQTQGSSFDALLAAYTGTSLGALTEVAIGTGSFGTPSRLSFIATAGTPYYIAVDGFFGQTGTVALAWSLREVPPPPANDLFANAQEITGAQGTTTGSNQEATLEEEEPLSNYGSNGASVWYRWVAPLSGRATISTSDGDLNTLLAIYTGTSVSSLQTLAESGYRGAGQINRVRCEVVAGETYYIAVAGAEQEMGSFHLTWSAAAIQAPANDNFAQAQVLGEQGSVPGTVLDATREEGEPEHAPYSLGNTVWYQWTAPATIPEGKSARFRVQTEEFSPAIRAYSGVSLDALTPVTEARGYSVSAAFEPTAGQTYFIAVEAKYDAGDFTLQWGLRPTHPSNDNFADAQELTGLTGQIEGTIQGATLEEGEPEHARSNYKSVWYRWTATANGYVTFQVGGFQSKMAAYTGTSLPQLTTVASGISGDSAESQIHFAAQDGQTYLIAVDTYQDDTEADSLILTWSFEAGTIDDDEPVRPDWLDNEVYSPGGEGQTLEKSTRATETAVFDFFLTNRGSAPEGPIRVTAPPAPEGWSVRYFVRSSLYSESEEFTQAIQSEEGLVLRVVTGQDLDPFAKSPTVTVRVVPLSPQAASRNINVAVRAEAIDGSVPDVVLLKVHNTSNMDAAISAPSRSLQGRGVFNDTGENQTATFRTIPGRAARFTVRLYDDAADEQIRLHAPAGSQGWSVKYLSYDPVAQEQRNVTEEVTGEGWLLPKRPGDVENPFEALILEATPTEAVPLNDERAILIRAVSEQSGLVDAVQAVAVRTISGDAIVRPEGGNDTDFRGEGIFNISGQGQDALQAVARTSSPTAVFYLKVKNVSNAPDSYRITGPAQVPGATLTYRTEFVDPNEDDSYVDSMDVTATVTGAGWTSESVLSDEEHVGELRLRVEMALTSSEANGVIAEAQVHVQSADGNGEDVVTVKAGVQAVAGIESSLDQGDTWQAVASQAAVPLVPNQAVGLRALKAVPALPWPHFPRLQPTWVLGESLQVAAAPDSQGTDDSDASSANWDPDGGDANELYGETIWVLTEQSSEEDTTEPDTSGEADPGHDYQVTCQCGSADELRAVSLQVPEPSP